MGTALSERIKIDANISVPSSLNSVEISLHESQVDSSSVGSNKNLVGAKMDVSKVSSYNSNFEYLETKVSDLSVIDDK